MLATESKLFERQYTPSWLHHFEHSLFLSVSPNFMSIGISLSIPTNERTNRIMVGFVSVSGNNNKCSDFVYTRAKQNENHQNNHHEQESRRPQHGFQNSVDDGYFISSSLIRISSSLWKTQSSSSQQIELQ